MPQGGEVELRYSLLHDVTKRGDSCHTRFYLLHYGLKNDIVGLPSPIVA